MYSTEMFYVRLSLLLFKNIFSIMYQAKALFINKILFVWG